MSLPSSLLFHVEEKTAMDYASSISNYCLFLPLCMKWLILVYDDSPYTHLHFQTLIVWAFLLSHAVRDIQHRTTKISVITVSSRFRTDRKAEP